MSAPRIARLDALRLFRSPGLWVATVLFALLVVAGVTLPALLLESPPPEIGAAFLLGPAADLVLPVIAIVLTYAAVAGLRADGRVKVLLGTPVGRRSILIGVLLSRIVAAWAITGAGVLVGIAAIVVLYGVPPLRPVASFVLLTLLATASYVGVGIGVSAAVATSTRAIASLIAGFIVAHSLWEPLCRGLYYLVMGDLPGRSPPGWYDVLVLLSPVEAYTRAADGVLPPSPHLDIAIGEGGTRADAGALVGGEIGAATLGVALVSLWAWGTGAVLLGMYAFDTAEIE